MSAVQPTQIRISGGNARRALMMFVALPIMTFLVFGLTVAMDYPSNRYAMIGLSLLTMMVGLVPAILDYARPADRRHLLLTVYCLLFIAHFALPIFTQYASAIMPSDPPGVSGGALYPSDVVAGQGVLLFGLLSLLLGYGLLPVQLTDRDIERRKARDWRPEIILVVAGTMLILGWTISISAALGLIPAILGSGVISTVASSVVFGNALLTIAYLRHRSLVALLMLLIAVPISATLGFFTGSKRMTLIVPAVVVFTSMLLGGRFRTRWIVIGALTLTLLYPISEVYRGTVLQGYDLTIVDALSDPEYTLRVLSDFLTSSETEAYLGTGLASTAARLDAVGIVSVIVRDTPSAVPFQDGRTLGLFFVAFIPRLFWPGKPPITLGQWITDTYGSGAHIHSATGPSFIGDLYLNFGVASVVVGMLVLGALLRLVQTRLLGPHPTAVGILAAIVVMMQLITKQIASAAYVLSATAFAFAPVFAVSIAVAILARRSPPPQMQAWGDQNASGSSDLP
ncbi:MAG: hypothetical protein H8E78_04845 [Proteobacteria bacterium]|nr:hypothetical protein [Pseudomonadota bacterium]